MSRRRGGAVLFEMVISMAIFVVVAAFTLSATRNVASALEQARREQRAVDLVRSRLAELEAGLINLEDLRDGVVDGIGSFEGKDDASDQPPRWRYEVRTSRSAFAGLTLLELTIHEEGAPGVSLRQLLRLREGEVEAYQEDEMFEPLPAPERERSPEPSREAPADEESEP